MPRPQFKMTCPFLNRKLFLRNIKLFFLPKHGSALYIEFEDELNKLTIEWEHLGSLNFGDIYKTESYFSFTLPLKSLTARHDPNARVTAATPFGIGC